MYQRSTEEDNRQDTDDVTEGRPGKGHAAVQEINIVVGQERVQVADAGSGEEHAGNVHPTVSGYAAAVFNYQGYAEDERKEGL